jgi:hypothetical protein
MDWQGSNAENTTRHEMIDAQLFVDDQQPDKCRRDVINQVFANVSDIG